MVTTNFETHLRIAMGRGAGNASSRNGKKKPAAKGKELTPESNDESSLCGLCCEPVKDEEDDGLYCEGSCAQWFHCYCAGVTVPQFEWLSNSSTPFLCYACFQEENRAKVLSLEEKVAALTIELTELKTVLDGHRKAESNTWTEVVKRGRRMQTRSGGRTNRNESRTTSTAVNANVQQEGPLPRARTGENVRSDENARTDTGKSRPSNTSTLIPMQHTKPVYRQVTKYESLTAETRG